MESIYYWSPCLTKVGTYKATINSAISLSKYYKKKYNVKIINICGEWDEEKDRLEKNNIQVIDLGLKYYKYLPKKGFFNSRLSFATIFILSFIPLLNLLTVKKPNYIVAHLITSLPILLVNIFKIKSKLILRISGYPKLNFLRLNFWKFAIKKIFMITCPSKDLVNQIKRVFVFDDHKIHFLPDPIICLEEFRKKNKKLFNLKNEIISSKEYFISIGRLTKQKNFQYLIHEFSSFRKLNPKFNLLIFGEGEERNKLKEIIENYNLKDTIFLMGYSDIIYYYMKNAKALILSSLWEDPGFVLIESALCNLSIISSDCKNGPREFLNNGDGGFLFESNKKNALKNKILEFIGSTNKTYSKKIYAKKNSLKYTMFRHSKKFVNILSF